MIKNEYELAYNAQKPLPVKALLKLKIGDVVEVKWRDAPNSRLVLAERMPRDKAKRWSASVLTSEGLGFLPDWDQIVRVPGTNIFDLDVFKLGARS